MNPSQFFSEFNRRLAVAYVMMGVVLILTAATLLAFFEVAGGGVRVLGRTLAVGKVHPLVRRST